MNEKNMMEFIESFMVENNWDNDNSQSRAGPYLQHGVLCFALMRTQVNATRH